VLVLVAMNVPLVAAGPVLSAVNVHTKLVALVNAADPVNVTEPLPLPFVVAVPSTMWALG
jgi:hypothetical protein